MSLTVTWATKVINIPQSYLTLLGGSLYELDVNQFRLDLRGIEAGEEGIVFDDAHRHVTQTVLGGFTYARLVEILSPYTVTFEDLQYGVNSFGANHNLSDVINRNQVSLLTQNSAGLVNSPEIEYASFDDRVTVDLSSSFSGTTYPNGTRRQPVNNFADALLIRAERGLPKLHIIGNATLASGTFDSAHIMGDGESQTTLTVDALASTVGSEFHNVTLQGTLDSGASVHDSLVLNCSMVDGIVKDCRARGTITLTGSSIEQFSLINCVDDLAGLGIPTINCGGDGPAVIVRGYRGGLALENKSGAADISIDGTIRLILNTGFAGAGDLLVRGLGPKIDNQASFPESQLMNQLVDPDDIELTRKLINNRLEIDFTTQELVLYDDDGTTVIQRWDLDTKDGEDIATATGVQTKRGVPKL